MKTIRLFWLFTVMALMAVSCSDDDNDLESSIVGAWQSEIHTSRIWIFMSDGQVVSETVCIFHGQTNTVIMRKLF